MPLKILIVEDEVLIAETIRMYVQEFGYSVTEMCISYDEAVAAYQHQKPDLAILDIRLYGQQTGIDFAHYLNQQPQRVPFVYLNAQHDNRTFDLAFATAPEGYLVKPIQKRSLWATLKSLEHRIQMAKTDHALRVSDGQNTTQIAETDILYIESEHVYITFHFRDGSKLTTRTSLSQIVQDVNSRYLVRCHRSYIVNTQYVESWNHNSLTLRNGKQIPVSRSKKAMIFERLTVE